MTSTVFVDKVTVIEASWLNDVNGVVYNLVSGKTIQTATAGQTVFTVPAYTLGGSMGVWINGILQQYNVAYTETNTTTITFSEGLTVGLVITTD